MARNRRPQPKAEKRAELVDAARELFLRDGYEATSVSRVAQAASVAPNTLYWYFADKDALFVAVLDDVLAEDLVAYADVAGAPLAEQAMWFVERLRRGRELMATVHARLAVSPAIRTWHDAFHTLIDQITAQHLPGPVDPDVFRVESTMAAFVIEGLVTHDVPEADARRVCEALAERAMEVASASARPG